MKRDHKPKYEGLFPVFTLFGWKQCCKCGMDFRRERGWQFWTGPFYAGRGGLKYLCRECAPSEEVAYEIANLHIEPPTERPKGPPPPPPPTANTSSTGT